MAGEGLVEWLVTILVIAVGVIVGLEIYGQLDSWVNAGSASSAPPSGG